jgi:hypothetical protein
MESPHGQLKQAIEDAILRRSHGFRFPACYVVPPSAKFICSERPANPIGGWNGFKVYSGLVGTHEDLRRRNPRRGSRWFLRG